MTIVILMYMQIYISYSFEMYLHINALLFDRGLQLL